MVAIVGGSGLGLFNSSLGVLGGQGGTGNANLGRSGENVYVNGQNGNLVIQRQDELLLGLGPDLSLLRTYNSQGQFADDNGDNWRLNLHKRLSGLTGTVNTVGSSITRTDADGAELLYIYDATRGCYVNTDGAGSYDTLSFDQTTNQWTWTDGTSQVKETYDWNDDGNGSVGGKLVSLADIDGNTITYGYTGDLLSSVTDASGQTTYLDYVGTNLVAIRTVSAGGVEATRVRYDYDALNRLTSVTVDLSPEDNSITDGKTYVTNYTYDGTSKRIASITQTDGSSVQFGYTTLEDGTTRITQISQQVSGSNGITVRNTTLAYDLTNQETTITDPLGNQTVQRHDSEGRLIQLQGPALNGSNINGASQIIHYSYDAQGNVISQTDALGQTISYEYDGNGNVTLQRDAAGNTLTRTYGDRNELLTETVYLSPDPDGSGIQQPAKPQTSRYVYDAQGHLRFAVSAEGRVTEYRYNAFGQQVSNISYVGNAYDLAGLNVTDTLDDTTLSNWIDGGGVDKRQTLRTEMAYNFRGQLASLMRYTNVDAMGNGMMDGTQSTTHYVYDQAGLLLKTIAPKGVATTGNDNNEANDYVTSYTYDGMGRLLTSTDTLGQVTTTQYDDAGNKTITTLVNGLSTTSSYNSAGELLSVMQANGAAALGETKYFYDAAGKLRVTQDPTGVKNYILYDAAGRKVATIDGNGSVIEYRTNANNQVIQTIVYGRALSSTVRATLVDANGQPANITVDAIRPAPLSTDQKVRHIYDVAGRLVKSIDALGYVTETQYDGASRIVSVTQYANAIDVTLLTDTTQATDAAVTPTVNAAQDRTTRYFYDHDGRQIATLDGEGYLTENEYDAVGRLVHTIAYATKTDTALWTSGSPDQLRPTSSNQDLHRWTIYDGQSRVIGAINGEGYLNEVIYDVNGNVTQTIAYATKIGTAPDAITQGTSLGQLRPASNNQDRISSTTYTELNQIATTTDAQGTVTVYTYNNVGQLIQTDKAFGTEDVRTLQAQYDVQGRLTGELTSEGSAALAGLTEPTQEAIDAIWAQYGITHAYDQAGRRISTTDQNGNKTRFYYDVDGQLNYTINALGEVQRSYYNALGQLSYTVRYATRIDAASLESLEGGLIRSDLSTLINGLANSSIDTTIDYTYNARGEIISTTDALGHVNTVAYDAFGNVQSTSRQIDGTQTVTTQYTVDRRGQVTQTIEDATGINRITQAIYDAFGRMTRSTDALGKTTTTAYDRLGRQITVTDPNNATRSQTYDAFSQVLSQTDALGNTTTYTYDLSNRSMTLTTAEGVSVTTKTNRLGQTVEVIDGKGQTTSYAYDENGNLNTSTDALGNSTTNVYDHASRLIETINANGTVTQYAYDAANRLLTRTQDPSGLALTTSYTYDAKGQVVSVTDANGTVTETQYDKKGQVTSVTVDPTGLNLQTTYTYDADGRTLTVTTGAGSTSPHTTQYVYDVLGRRTQEIVDPNGLAITTSYTYDQNNNVIAKTDANGNVTRFAYDSNNRLSYTVDAQGGVTQTTYDANGKVIEVTAYATALSALDLASLGQGASEAEIAARLTINANDQTSRYVYDQDGRLTVNVDALGYVTHQTYDANGNVTRTTRYATTLQGTFTQGMAPQILATAPAEAVTYSYIITSANDQIVQTEYDAANRVTDITNPLGSVTHIAYDANGNVTDKTQAYGTSTAVLTHYVYDTANRLTDETRAYGTALAVTRHLVYNAQSQVTDETQAWGTAQAVTTHMVYDAAGRCTARTVAYGKSEAATTFTEYDAFGNAVSITDPLGNVGTFWFDAANRAVLHVDPEGYATATSYNAMGEITQIRRYVTQLVTQQTGSFDPDTLPSLTANDAQDQITTLEHDKLGRQTKMIDAEGAFETTTFDAFGNKISFTNKIGGTTTYTYDADNQLISETLPITSRNAQGESVAVTHTYAYDARGNKTRSIEAAGLPEQRTTTYVYDLLDRPIIQMGDAISVYNAATDTTSIVIPTATSTYDIRGNLIETMDASGARTLAYYNALNQKVATVSAVGELITYQYDAAGNVTSLYQYATPISLPATAGGSIPGGIVDAAHDRERFFTYDANGRKITTTIQDVRIGERNSATGAYESGIVAITTRQVYDANGNVIQSIDARNNSTYLYYDKLGRQIAQIDAENYLTVWEYGNGETATTQTRYANQLSMLPNTTTDITDLIANVGVSESDRITETDYDKMGRAIETRTLNVVYGSLDANGALTSNLTASARTTYVYNGLGLVTQQTVYTSTTATEVTDKAYDLIGRQTQEKKPTFLDYTNTLVRPTTELVYDALSNVTQKIDRGTDNTTNTDDHFITFTYGAGGQLLSQTDAVGATTYFYYDVNGKLTRSHIDRQDADNNTYNDETRYQYDASGKEIWRSTLSKLSAQTAYTTLETNETRYNVFGDVTGKRTNGGGTDTPWQETADYDNAGRAWKANSGDGVYKVYLFDANGNATMTIVSANTSGAGFANLALADVLALDGDLVHLTISQFDKRNAHIATYEPTMEGLREAAAIGQFISQQTGTAFSGGAVTVGSVLTPYTKATQTPIAQGGVGNRVQFGATISLSSTEKHSTYGNRDHDRYTYASGAADAVNFSVDTRGWGDGAVKIALNLGALSVFKGYATTLTLTTEQARNYALGFNETVSGYINTSATFSGTRNFSFTVTKVTAQGEISLGTYTCQIGQSGTSGVGSITAFTPRQIILREQPTGTSTVVMQYRPANSGADWKLASAVQMTSAAGGVMAGWYSLDWTNETQWPRGSYEYSYVALDASGNVLNSEAGTFALSEANYSTINQSPRTIGGAGRVFMELGGKLHITEQGSSATNLSLRYRRPDGEWSNAVTVPRYSVGGTDINGWFVFDASAAGLAGTYEYMLEASDGSGNLVNRASGVFTFANTGTSSTGELSTAGVGGVGNRVQFGATISLSSTEKHSTYGNRDHDRYTYASGAADAVNFSVDTRGWGDGAVKIALNLGALSVFKGYATTLTLTTEQARNYALGFNETVSGYINTSATFSGTRNFSFTVTKVTAQGEISLGTYTCQIGQSGTSGVGSITAFTPRQIILREQPTGTSTVVMQYRPANSGADWKLASAVQMTSAAGGVMAGWYSLDWTNETQWPRGSYEYSYVALDASGNVLNSEAGTFALSEANYSTINQSPRTIGGAGRVFMELGGKLHITEQGSSATNLSLRYRRPDGEWSNAVTVPRYSVGGTDINGWFVFDASAAGLAGTYEYMLEASDGSGNLVNRASGVFTFANTGTSSTGELSTAGVGGVGNRVQFGATISLSSTEKHSTYGNRDHDRYTYASGAADAVNFSVDTRGWGDGAVKIALNLGALSVFKGYATTLTLTTEQARNYALGFNETVSGYINTSATFSGTRNFSFTVTKVTAQGEISLGTYTCQIGQSGTSGVGSITAFTPRQIILREQPTGTSTVVMQYRPANSGADWKLASAVQMTSAAGGVMAGWYSLDWTNETQWPRGSYEYSYVALDASGNVLNSEAGTFALSEANYSTINQSPRTIGGAGRVFMELGGKLHITEQGSSATNLSLRYRRPDGEWSNWVSVPRYKIGGTDINGWFVFDPATFGLSGTYEFEFETFNAEGTKINMAKGTFVYDDPTLTNYAQNPAMVHFTSQPASAQKMVISYRLADSEDAYETMEVNVIEAGSGAFDWDASQIVTNLYADYRYEYKYQTFDTNNVIVNEAHGVIQLGAHPTMESHINGYITPTLVNIGVQQTTARQLALYYRLSGTWGTYTAAPVLVRSNGTDAFVWDASSIVPPGTSVSLEYYYELFDENGVSLTEEGTPFISGTLNLGQSNTQGTEWIVTGLNVDDIAITRSQTYNAFGEVVQEIDGNGHITDLSYNTQGKLVQKQDPQTTVTYENGYQGRERPVTTYTYDLAGRVIAVTDANGHTNKQSWVAGTNLGQNEYHADYGTKTSGYDIFGNLRWAKDELGRETQYEYDAAGRLTKLTRPATGGFDIYEYDAAGNRIAHVTTPGKDADGNDILYRDRTYYDGLSRVTQTTTAAGYDTIYGYTYDSDILGVGGLKVGGYEKTISYANGHTSTEHSDAFNHTTWREDLGDHQYTYTYNAAGWLTHQTSTAGQDISYAHYANGYIHSISDNALGTVTAYEYDREGNKTRELYKRDLGNGNWGYDQNAEIFYDELNRIVRINDSSADIQYEYDAVGNRRRVYSQYYGFVNKASGGVEFTRTSQDYWYEYDTMNRFVTSMGTLSGTRGASETDTSGSVVRGFNGIALAYNAAGERVGAEYTNDKNNNGVLDADETLLESYTYNANGQLEDTLMNGALRAHRNEDLLGRVTSYQEFDGGGHKTLQRATSYDADSKQTNQEEWQWVWESSANRLKAHNKTTNTYGGGGGGELTKTTQLQYAVGGGSNTTINTSYTYQWWDEAKQIEILLDPTQKGVKNWKDGFSKFTYDVNGHLLRVDDLAAYQAGMGRSITYRTDAQGLILQRTENAGGTADSTTGIVVNGNAVMTHSFIYVDGHRVGDTGNDGNALTTSGKSYAEDLTKYAKGVKKSEQYKNWKPVASADFDQNYQPVNAQYPAMTPSSFTVRAGDTLQSVAAAVWGDSAMWYLIADANGLSSSTALTPGQALTIPNKVTNIHNNASTFKPYNAGETIGNTSPTLPNQPPPKKGGCGGIGMIIMIVVAVVAACIIGPAVLALVAGPGATVATATMGQLLLAGALTGAATSAVSQGVGMAMGVQSSFSWKGVAMGAIAGAVTAGVTGTVPGVQAPPGAGLGAAIAPSSGAFTQTVINGVASNTITQGIGIATGLQKNFSWTSVAVAGVSSAVSYGVNQAIGSAQYDSQNGSQSGSWDAVQKGGQTDLVSNAVVRAFASNFIGSVSGQLATGQPINWASVTGNAIGQAIVTGCAASDAIAKRDAAKGAAFTKDVAIRQAQFDSIFGNAQSQTVAYGCSQGEAANAGGAAYDKSSLTPLTALMPISGESATGKGVSSFMPPYTTQNSESENGWFTSAGMDVRGAMSNIKAGEYLPNMFKLVDATMSKHGLELSNYYAGINAEGRLVDVAPDYFDDMGKRVDIYKPATNGLAEQFRIPDGASVGESEWLANEANIARNSAMDQTREQLTDAGKEFSKDIKPEGKTIVELRDRYAERITQVKDANYDGLDDASKIEVNKKIVERSAAPDEITDNAAKEARNIDRVAKGLRIVNMAGKVVTVYAAAHDGMRFMDSVSDSLEGKGNWSDTAKEGARITAGWTGAAVGGKYGAIAGAAMCSKAPPWGVAICTTIGGIGGSVIGYQGGSEAVVRFSDNVVQEVFKEDPQTYSNFHVRPDF